MSGARSRLAAVLLPFFPAAQCQHTATSAAVNPTEAQPHPARPAFCIGAQPRARAHRRPPPPRYAPRPLCPTALRASPDRHRTQEPPSAPGRRGILSYHLQSYRQGQKVWGDAGMDAMWSASTIKVIGSGIDDPGSADKLSRLIGDHDVETTSTSHSESGKSTSVSMRQER
ncbi:TraM recognition domain-containing protein, partial [Streptomyces yokosukanensis]|uniref:TraM recognition domain-containing protein n=1 Tax=Streptomyces yokosukanensis TaxID=67386 RepID=UPI0024466418